MKQLLPTSSLVRFVPHFLCTSLLFIITNYNLSAQSVFGSWTLAANNAATSPTAGITASPMGTSGVMSSGGYAANGVWADASGSTTRVTSDYWQYKVTTDASTTATVTSFNLKYKEVTGAVTIAVYYSTDGSTFTQLGSTLSIGTVGYTSWSSGNTGLNIVLNPSTSFYLRFYAWHDGNGAVYNQLVTINGTTNVPSVASFSRPSVCAGDTVTINGTNLANVTAVTIGGTPVASITSNTATQIVAVVGAGSSGAVAVTTASGTGTSTATITVNTIPAQPVSITGSASICNNTTNTYSIASVSSATSYTWTLPTTWTGTSATNSISAVADTSSGTITVYASNACGTGNPQTLHVTNKAVPVVTAPTLSNVCSNAASFTLTGGTPAGGNFSGNGVSVGNVFNPSISGAGTFPIVYTYSNGTCSASATTHITVASCSGIATDYLNQEIKVYPNPFVDNTTVYISSTIPLTGAAIYLYDVLGKRVKIISNITTNEIVIERNNLSAGMYFYTFINNNRQISSGKLIVNN